MQPKKKKNTNLNQRRESEKKKQGQEHKKWEPGGQAKVRNTQSQRKGTENHQVQAHLLKEGKAKEAKECFNTALFRLFQGNPNDREE